MSIVGYLMGGGIVLRMVIDVFDKIKLVLFLCLLIILLKGGVGFFLVFYIFNEWVCSSVVKIIVSLLCVKLGRK